jgi:hypothetical protein
VEGNILGKSGGDHLREIGCRIFVPPAEGQNASEVVFEFTLFGVAEFARRHLWQIASPVAKKEFAREHMVRRRGGPFGAVDTCLALVAFTHDAQIRAVARRIKGRGGEPGQVEDVE